MAKLSLTLLLLVGCGGAQLPGEDPSPPLLDTNPDPAVVEVSIEAAVSRTEYLPGKPAEVWGYRDAGRSGAVVRVPGPMLEAKVGDQIIVHFRNLLPVATTIHWHGLRLPAIADGSTATQDPVLPGQEYEARFIANDAGTFWFHPHVKGEEQIERGLYAPFIVHEAEPPRVDADRTFILDDVKLEATGALSTTTDALDVMLGRQGNVLLVNGVVRPEIEGAPQAEERWRFIDAANGRYFKLRLPGRSFRVIAWDGGRLAQPYETETLLIAPGERYDVLVVPVTAPGERVTLYTEHYDRGHEVPDPGPKPLLEVVGSNAEARPHRPLELSAPVEAALSLSSTTVVRRFVLREQEDEAGLRFLINEQAWPFNQPVMVTQGDTEIWELENRSEMDHPFHIHGLFFEVLSVDGQAPAHRGWKDTLNLPQKTTTRIALRYETIGMWMFHCHILEHAERGMMGDLMIMP